MDMSSNLESSQDTTVSSASKGGLRPLSDRSELHMADKTMDMQYSGESSMSPGSISLISLMSIME